MEWKEIAADVGKSAPLLGTLIGGPIGTVVGTAGALIASALGVENTPDAVSQALKTDPQAAITLATIEKDRQIGLQDLAEKAAANQLAADTAAIQAVNNTMIAETKSEHWMSWAWRPFCGFITGTMVFGTYFVLPLLKLPVPEIPLAAWGLLGSILGVASWFRGQAQANPANPAPVRG